MSKLVFFLRVHKLPEQFLVTYQSLQSTDCRYLIHVDPAADDDLVSVATMLDNMATKTEMLPPEAETYASFDMAYNKLRGIQHMLRHDDWTHFVSMSGQCLPLLSIPAIRKQIQEGVSYVEWCDAKVQWWGTVEKRVSSVWAPDKLTRQLLSLNVPIGHLMPPMYAGGSWMVLSREACEYLVCPELAGLRALMSLTRSADEHFFQTALLNSPLRDRTVNRPLWYDFFPEDGQHPKTFTYDDIPELQRARDTGYWFARKFDTDLDHRVVSEVLSWRNDTPDSDGYG